VQRPALLRLVQRGSGLSARRVGRRIRAWWRLRATGRPHRDLPTVGGGRIWRGSEKVQNKSKIALAVNALGAADITKPRDEKPERAQRGQRHAHREDDLRLENQTERSHHHADEDEDQHGPPRRRRWDRATSDPPNPRHGSRPLRAILQAIPGKPALSLSMPRGGERLDCSSSASSRFCPLRFVGLRRVSPGV
jgi:hypothetical protein